MKKGMIKKKLAFIFTVVLSIGLVSYVPNEATKVQAEGAATKTNVELGTSKIANPTSTTGAWTGSYVYFGGYNDNVVKYRVLDNETTVFSGSDENVAKTMLLDCDSVLITEGDDKKFDKDDQPNKEGGAKNDWSISDIKRFLNSEKDQNNETAYDYSLTGFLTTSFSKTEQNAIAKSNKTTATDGDGSGAEDMTWTSLSGEQIFLLDAKEATNTSYGYGSADSRKKTPVNALWWLRSAYSNGEVGGVGNGGDISNYNVNETYLGVSPALNIKLSSVLFSSEISAGSGEYKLTLIDDKLNIALEGNVTRENNEVTIPYKLSGDEAGNVNQVSVLITENKYESGNVNEVKKLYYAALSLSGNKGTFSLPADSTLDLSDKVCGKDYYAYIVAEDVNGTYETDYASEPCRIDIPSKPWEAPTVNTINIGTNAIANPFQPVSDGDVNTAWTGNYVYFGTYNGSSLKYRVLDSETTVFSKDSTTKTMLLDCDSTLGQCAFNANDNQYWEFPEKGSGEEIIWKNSDIKKYLNDTFLKSSFSTIERNSIAVSVKLKPDENDGPGKEDLAYFPLWNDNYIFILDAKEATNTNYGYSKTCNQAANRGKGKDWWLRSYVYLIAKSGNGVVHENGVMEFLPTDDSSYSASPALNINLSSILFSSKADDTSKSSILSTTSSKIGTDQVTEWKLTLKDSGKSVSVTEGEIVTKKSDGTITVPYTYSDSSTSLNETVNQISVMITDLAYNADSAKILYYGKLDTTLSTGTGIFGLPCDLSSKTLGTDYHLYILAEHISGEKVTDYASEPAEIKAIVTKSTTSSKTDTDDSNSSSSDTNTGSTTTGSTDTGNNTLSPKRNNSKKTAKTDTTTETGKEKEESSSKDDKETKQDSKKDDTEVKENQTKEETTNNIIKEASEILEEDKAKLNDAVEKIRKVDENIQTGPYILSDTDEISFDIPDEFKADKRTFYLMTADDEESIIILQNESAEEGKFETMGEAGTVYQLVFEDGETPLAAFVSNGGIFEEPENDKLIWPWIALGVLAVGGFVFFILCRKKKKDDE